MIQEDLDKIVLFSDAWKVEDFDPPDFWKKGKKQPNNETNISKTGAAVLTS